MMKLMESTEDEQNEKSDHDGQYGERSSEGEAVD